MEADAKSVAAAVAFLAEHSRAHANDDNALLYARLHGEVIERYGASGADCPSTDQRSVTRPQGAGCDIGAYELEAGAGAAGPTVVPAIDTPTPVPLLPITKAIRCVPVVDIQSQFHRIPINGFF